MDKLTAYFFTLFSLEKFFQISFDIIQSSSSFLVEVPGQICQIIQISGTDFLSCLPDPLKNKLLEFSWRQGSHLIGRSSLGKGLSGSVQLARAIHAVQIENHYR